MFKGAVPAKLPKIGDFLSLMQAYSNRYLANEDVFFYVFELRRISQCNQISNVIDDVGDTTVFKVTSLR